MTIDELECSSLELYKNDINKIIEYVKKNKRISLSTISDNYSWLNMSIIQDYLYNKCLKLGWHIEKLNGDNGYSVINIYSL